MAKRKLKKKVKKILFISIVALILLIVGIKVINNYKYKQTYEYKFLQKEYTLEEYKTLSSKLNNNELETLLSKDKNSNIVKLINEKYFMFKNLDRYLSYYEKNDSKSLNEIVALVNVNRDKDY